jgi:AraC-like DNA-binding protein
MQVNSRRLASVFAHSPCLSLRPFIKRFLVVEFPPLYRDAHLPDSGAVAAFSYRGNCRINTDQWAPQAAFTGLHETLRTHEHCHGHAVLLASFTPIGATAFLRPSQEEFAGRTTDLADVISRPAELGRLNEQLASSQNDGLRVKLLEDFLLSRLSVSAPDPLVAAAVAWLQQKTDPKRIDDLTRYIGLSQSALERRFRRIVGISPKKFASLVRLRHAVQLRTAGTDLTTAAHGAGYYDQSHFIKDFRRATGRAPEAFFREVPAD